LFKKAWYILNYHDINWELGPINSGIGGTFSPEMFNEHLKSLNSEFELISVSEGFNRLKNHDIDRPILSIWFDDGLIGIRKYAFDILESYGIKAATSICSSFFLKEEMFWRFKLSYIASTDGLKVLRTRLKDYGYSIKNNVKNFSMNSFSKDLLDVIDKTYDEFSPEHFRKDAFRIFDDVQGINFLIKNKWTIANHSASHYPVTEQSANSLMFEEFNKCEDEIQKYFGISTRFWVAPFDRPNFRAENLFEKFSDVNDGSKYLVMVGNQVNCNIKDNIIFRISVPYLNGRNLITYLKNI
jgi:peptidoglycan/xylan/chitin deacetylase (PgdA/CDA1 family)